MSLKSWQTPVGFVLALIGVIWFLQGIGVLGGSAMSGVVFWAVAGVVFVLAGAALVAVGVRRK